MDKTGNYKQFKACIKMVMSQTNYNEEEATNKLNKWDNDFIKVIKEYLNPDFQKKKTEKKKSLNQAVIGEIRKFKDKQCQNYIKEKNNEYEINKLLYLNSLKLDTQTVTQTVTQTDTQTVTQTDTQIDTQTDTQTVDKIQINI